MNAAHGATPAVSNGEAPARFARSKQLGLLGSLYFSQGLPFGFFTQALPVLLRQGGYSLEHIGLSALLAMPWALKFLWAPLVDRYGSPRLGRRRSWLIPLQLLGALLSFALASFAPQGNLTPLLVAVFVANLLAATQDIATDALALDLLAPEDRGLGNGIQVAGYRAGMIFGGGFILAVFEPLGWAGSFCVMGAALLLASLPILLFRERSTEPAAERSAARATRGAEPEHREPHFLFSPGALRVLTLLVAYKFGESFASAMLRPLLIDRGFSLSELGRMLGFYGFIAGLVGALAGGALVRQRSMRRSLLTFGSLQAVSVASYAILSTGSVSRLLATSITVLEHFLSGMATAALFTCMMNFCRPSRPATDYTVQASVVVLASGLASSLSGYSAATFGYAGHFWLAAAACVLGLGVVARTPRAVMER